MSNPDSPSSGPPSRGDPRLEIPEVLRKPVKTPELLRPKPVSATAIGLGDLGRALAIGIDFLVTIAAGGGIGWAIDRWRGWAPYGLMIGLGIGFAVATVRIIQRTNKEDRARTARPPSHSPGAPGPPR